MRETPPLDDDQRVVGLLSASVAQNVATLLHVLEHDVDPERRASRVHRAVEIGGRSFHDDRLGLELALLACEQLGTSVLQPAHHRSAYRTCTNRLTPAARSAHIRGVS
jgi:hypothetical protein